MVGYAQPPAVPLLLGAGKWLGRTLISYAAGKAIDKFRGTDYQTQLQEMEAGIQAQLRKGSGDAKRLRAELEVAHSQLAILDSLLNSKPTQEDLEEFKRHVARDLDKLLEIQKQHGERISKLERGERVSKLEKEVGDLSARLRRLEARDSGAEGSTRKRPQVAPERRQSGASSAPGSRRRSGVTLILIVSGQENQISVTETTRAGDANLGTFEIHQRGTTRRMTLLSGTGGVVTLKGDANVVRLPSHLCGRVRVVDKGSRNRVTGCP